MFLSLLPMIHVHMNLVGEGPGTHFREPLFSDLRLQGSLVGESVTGVFLLRNEGDNMYK